MSDLQSMVGGGWTWPTVPNYQTPDYTMRCEAMRQAIQFANNDITADFAATLKHAHSIYRFLLGQTCPACGPEKE